MRRFEGFLGFSFVLYLSWAQIIACVPTTETRSRRSLYARDLAIVDSPSGGYAPTKVNCPDKLYIREANSYPVSEISYGFDLGQVWRIEAWMNLIVGYQSRGKRIYLGKSKSFSTLVEWFSDTGWNGQGWDWQVIWTYNPERVDSRWNDPKRGVRAIRGRESGPTLFGVSPGRFWLQESGSYESQDGWDLAIVKLCHRPFGVSIFVRLGDWAWLNDLIYTLQGLVALGKLGNFQLWPIPNPQSNCLGLYEKKWIRDLAQFEEISWTLSSSQEKEESRLLSQFCRVSHSSQTSSAIKVWNRLIVQHTWHI